MPIAPSFPIGAPYRVPGQGVFSKPCEAFLLVVVLVLVPGFSEFLDYEHERDDENEPGPTCSRHVLSVFWRQMSR